jgi:hypothetical protein
MRDSTGNHYERAFESWLLDHRVEYTHADEHERIGPPRHSVKNFDFLLRPCDGRRVIAEVKGRSFKGTRLTEMTGFECWVTRDDVESLELWRRILGSDHEAVFVFVYRVLQVDVDFDGRDVFHVGGDRYLFYCVRLDDYRRHMKRRSPKWKTVTLPADKFREVAIALVTLLE